MASARSWLPLAAMVAGWYGLSFVTDLLNKTIQQEVKIPTTLTALQFLAGGIFSTIHQRVLSSRPFKSVAVDDLRRVMNVAMCWTLGFLATNNSFGQAAVSFTHAVKATEPLFLVILCLLFFHGSFASSVYLSLLPIVVGICLVAMTELDFSGLGLLMACISNVCFAARSLFAKDLVKDKLVDNYSLFYYISWMSFGITVPLALMTESDQLLEMVVGMTPSLLMRLVANGTLHYAYNQLSFMILGEVTPLSHSVLNATRRFVIIFGAVLYFGTHLTPLNIVGICFLLVGVFAYTVSQNRSAAPAAASSTKAKST